MMKRILSILLTSVLLMSLFSIVPVSVSAATSGAYEYKVLDNGTAEITGYSGKGGSVVIPSTLHGYTVTRIGSEAFYKNETITSVKIPDTVIDIRGSYKINMKSSLPNIWAGSWESFNNQLSAWEQENGPVYTIDYVGAFAYCSNLKTVVLGSSVKSIGKGAFYDCDSIESIIIPESVTTIEPAAFYDCNALRSVDILGAANIASQYTGEEYGLGFVYLGAYYDSVEDMTIDVQAPIQYDASGPFEQCSNLKKVHFENGCKMIGYRAFSGCVKLSDISLPDSITTIYDEAFAGSGLNSITIPNSVSSIGYSAFIGCSSLTAVTIPDSVTNISYHAFYDCSSLTSVELNCPVIPSYIFAECKSLKSVTLGNSVTSVGEKAFHGCTSLKSIIIPKSVKHIGDKAFGYYYDVIGSQTHSTQLKNFHIYGYRNTVGELYASENDFLFTALDEEPEKKTGDADGDGEVTLMDATVLQGFFASIITDLNEEDLMVADIDKNGLLEIIDVTFIQRYAAEMEIPYPIDV